MEELSNSKVQTKSIFLELHVDFMQFSTLMMIKVVTVKVNKVKRAGAALRHVIQ
jgi:hypothetical protein